jgi:hypothetical protein
MLAGDSIGVSTLRILFQLWILDNFLKLMRKVVLSRNSIPTAMENPSASKFDIPRISTIEFAKEAPRTPLTIANVVTIPSKPP